MAVVGMAYVLSKGEYFGGVCRRDKKSQMNRAENQKKRPKKFTHRPPTDSNLCSPLIVSIPSHIKQSLFSFLDCFSLSSNAESRSD